MNGGDDGNGQERFSTATYSTHIHKSKLKGKLIRWAQELKRWSKPISS
jgi:hypothetical protein